MLLLFGHSGQVASELRAAAAAQRVELRPLSSQEADFRDPQRIREIVAGAPAGTCVVNAAAYTQVDQAESEPETAELINAVTPGVIAEECGRRNFPFIHLSTDYVFAGDKTTPYVESDPVSPMNVYGRTKRDGEERIFRALAPAIVLRTAWVFSSHGKNFVKTMLQLGQKRQELNVVADQFGGPTSAAAIARICLELARQILQKESPDALSGVYHYCGAPAVSWHGFAEEIFRQAGLKVTVHPIPAGQYPTPAARPHNSILNCDKIFRDFGISQPDWRQELTKVLQDLQAP